MIAVSIPWLILILSVAAELAGTLAMKYSYGFTQLTPSLLTAIFYVAAVGLMSIAAKSIDISTLYPIWAAASTVLISLSGCVLFSESITSNKALGMLFSVSGIFLLDKEGDA